MRGRLSIVNRIGGLTLGLFLATGGARAETVNCTPITSVPYFINAQGVYCLTGDLSTAQSPITAIFINANNVVVDLNGHKLGGLAAGPGTESQGIGSLGAQNITIRNGTIRGFLYGISLNDTNPANPSQGHVIENIRADQNTYVGIYVAGRGCLVRNNQVVQTGGSTVQTYATGIVTGGSANRLIENDIITVTPRPGGFGHGFYLNGTSDNLLIDNRITNAPIGIHFNGSSGKYQGNLTSGVAFPYSGGTDAGNNN